MIARYLLIDWPQFAAALVVLLTPISLFHGRKTRYRAVTRDWSRHWSQAVTLGLHSIDFGRAALGAWWLVDALHSVPDARGFARYAVVLSAAAIRLLAVVVQTVGCREPESLHAPFAFVAGLLLGGTIPSVSVLSLVLAVTVALGLRQPAVFFPVVGLVRIALGFWFLGRGAAIPFALDFGLASFPWLWSLLFSRELVVAYRTKRWDEDAPPAAHELR